MPPLLTAPAAPPALLLALETATDTCGVALFDGHVLVAEAALHRPRQHAAHLAPLVRDVLAHAGVTPQELAAVAVSAGPGSYTGLRIGTSTAKGLAFATGALLVAVPSLEAMAAAALEGAEEGDAVAAAFSSRRGEVYAAAFRVDAGHHLSPEREAASIPFSDLAAWLPEDERLWLAGEAAPALAEAAGARGGIRRLDVPPSAARVGRLALTRWREGRTENVASFEPYYVSAFVPGPTRAIFAAPPSTPG